MLPLLRARRLRWSSLDGGGSLRLLVGVAALLLAWSFATLDLNLYTDRWHVADRVLLAATALLVFVHPGFVAPCALLAALMADELHHPLGAYSWTDKLPVFQLLLLFSLWSSLAAVRRADPRAFVAVALIAHAAHYVEPGLGKWEIGWMESQRMADVWVAAHLNGWLPGLAPAEVVAAAHGLDRANALMIWGTLAIELAPVLLLVGRRYAAAVLAGAAGLHAGIFLASGIFFWKWMLLNLAWILLLLGPGRAHWAPVFGPRSVFFWLCIPLSVWGTAIFAPVRLAWINTPLEHTYEIEAVGASGTAYPVSRAWLSPHDLNFAQNRFAFLVEEPHLAMTYGGTRDLEAAAALRRARTPEQVLAADRRFGRVHRDEARARRFDRLLRRIFSNLNRRGAKPAFPLGAPAHIWAWRGEGAYALQEPVRELRVRWISTWYDGRQLVRLRDRVVREIPIEPEARLSGP